MESEFTKNRTGRQLDFTGDAIYVGIDVHKKQWNVSIMGEYKEHKTFVQPPDAVVLGNYLRDHFPNATYYSVYEAGFSGFWAHEALTQEGIINKVVNASDVPTTDKEKRQKSDTVDSRKLCRCLRDDSLTGIYVPSRQQQEDRNAVRLRKKLVRDIARCKNRIKGLLNYYGISVPDDMGEGYWPKRFIKWLSELNFDQDSGKFTMSIILGELISIQKLKKELDRQLVLMAKQKYEDQVKLLRSIPGIGLIGSLTFLTELGNVKRFKSFDQLCSYVGLVPNVYSSGETEHVGHMTKRKNIYLQPLLIQCAWQAVGKDPALMKAYQDWCKVMKANKAIIRIARKLLSRIRFVLVNQKEYTLRTL
ncbi:IS110 family transposase [Dyadobacter luteus]|uniref:IS110 family transposase n=1 Tax=Dyadobacter luteus TaxID=2259619 RepID=A0A3D8Y212_9BACT|nr:IS110 family transposase [Dyadobacter luteus]REA54792.1 IS110 family transposase [Dyadobacter luteus]